MTGQVICYLYTIGNAPLHPRDYRGWQPWLGRPAFCQRSKPLESCTSLRDPGTDPSCMLLDRFSGWQVVGQVTSGRASGCNPPQPVEDFMQLVGALGRILANQCQVRGYGSPLLVGNGARVRLRFDILHATVPGTEVHDIPWWAGRKCGRSAAKIVLFDMIFRKRRQLEAGQVFG